MNKQQDTPRAGSTRIMPCSCKSEWQDKEYGKGMRVMNATLRNAAIKTEGYRCTVCGTSRIALGGSERKE